MKSSITFWTAICLIFSLSSCSDDEFNIENSYDKNVVSFSVNDNNMSRAGMTEAAGPTDVLLLYDEERRLSELAIDVCEHDNRLLSDSQPFRCATRSMPLEEPVAISVSAFLPDGKLYFEEKDIVASTIGGQKIWISDKTHYWPDGKLDFYAYTNIDPTDSGLSISDESILFSYSPYSGENNDDANNQPDIAMAFNSTAKTANGNVPLVFSHALAGISFTAEDSEDFKIKKVTIRNLAGTGDCIYNPKGEIAESPFIWTLGQEKSSYSQNVTDRRYTLSGKQGYLTSPFMVIPQKTDNAEIEVSVVISGEEKTLTSSLKSLRTLRPGKIYNINISRKNALYPPVENLQYALGKDADGKTIVTLSWNLTETFPDNVHRNRLVIVDEANPENEIYPSSEGNYITDCRNYEIVEDYERTSYSFTVYVDYTNDNDGIDTPILLHRSIGRTVTFTNRVTVDVPCAFFLPHGYDPTRPVEELKDDDDQAAAYWFRNNASRGTFVNHISLRELNPADYPVLWVPSGIKQGDNRYNYAGGIGYVEGDYFTDEDRKAIRKYYEKGGNLLLTGFSIALLYDFGVIPEHITEYHPAIVLWNELKDKAVWFVRGNFEGHDCDSHPIYANLLKVDPTKLPYPSEQITSGGSSVPMYPLLSPDAEQCENNNIVWDFNDNKQVGKIMEFMEKDCSMKFIGTWGQINDVSVGTVAEFNKTSNHGTCICIGLGAFEYNNGMVFAPSAYIKNRYQTNVYRMTANALEYLNK